MNSTSPHTPPVTEEKCVSGPGAAPSLVVFDTSDLTRSPSGHTPTTPADVAGTLLSREMSRFMLEGNFTLSPTFTPRPMSRAQRRKAGDYRTARQIIADDMAAGRVK